jgi:hypothetical protein
VTPSTSTLIAHADELTAHGRALEAIAALTDVNRRQRDPEVERTLVRVRHAAWEQLDRTGCRRWDDADVEDRFAGIRGVPEISAADLDATTIRSATRNHGALLVRGLLPPRWCARLRESIDRTWEAIERYRSTKEFDPRWFDPLMEGGYGRDMASRMWGIACGTAYVADSPRLLFEMLEAFDELGMKQIVTEYFGEPPVLSLAKTAHRRLPPDATPGWHQDAAVYGEMAHALDLWVPVTRCGDIAPGLAVWPRRLDEVVRTVGPGPLGFETHPDTIAALTAEIPAVCPIFDPGDAIIIDELTLHSTQSDPRFTEPRYGLECWFFAPSTFPDPDMRVPLVY